MGISHSTKLRRPLLGSYDSSDREVKGSSERSDSDVKAPAPAPTQPTPTQPTPTQPAPTPTPSVLNLSGDAVELSPSGGIGEVHTRFSAVHCAGLTALGARRLIVALSDARSPLRALLRDGGVQRLSCSGARISAPDAAAAAALVGTPGAADVREALVIDAPSLRVLTLHSLRLRAVPDLRGCPRLEEVSLRDNLIAEVPSSAAAWLPAWPDAPDELTPRIALDLSSNCLQAVRDWPASFPLVQVVSINVAGNSISVPPPREYNGSVNIAGNNIEPRRAVLYALDPVLGRWIDPVTGLSEDAAWVPGRPRVPENKAKLTVYSSTQTVHVASVTQGVRESLAVIVDAARAAGAECSVADALQGLSVFSAAEARRPGRESVLRALAKECAPDAAEVLFFYGLDRSITYPALLSTAWSLASLLDALNDGSDVRRRLWQEIAEGMGLCFTGRMSRLVNAFSGFVEGVKIGISQREQLQSRAQAIVGRQPVALASDEGKPTLGDDWAREEAQACVRPAVAAITAAASAAAAVARDAGPLIVAMAVAVAVTNEVQHVRNRRTKAHAHVPTTEREQPEHGPAVRALRQELVHALHDAMKADPSPRADQTSSSSSDLITKVERDAWLDAFDEAVHSTA
jgi:hypothetical protein